MERTVGQPVIVMNKVGAGGALGLQSVASARPDGYTIGVSPSLLNIIPEADRLQGRAPAFTVDQFALLAGLTDDPLVLVVRTDSPWKSPRDFVDDANRRPDQVAFASMGLYGTTHVGMEVISRAAGLKLKHVPFAGAGPALQALLGGHVDVAATAIGTSLPQIRAGKLRPFAVLSDRRHPDAPDVPTFREFGLGNVEYSSWTVLLAPRGIPDAVVARLTLAARTAVSDPAMRSSSATRRIGT
jgi:tripartite-type tricarboxylate transporter receptor subunit TctC